MTEGLGNAMYEKLFSEMSIKEDVHRQGDFHFSHWRLRIRFSRFFEQMDHVTDF